MQSVMAPIGLASCLEQAHASRTSRQMRCLSVLLHRSLGLVGRRRHHLLLHHLWIRVTRGGLTVGLRQLGPQVLGPLGPAIAAVTGHALACLGIHGTPPLLVRLLLDKAGPGRRGHLQARAKHCVRTGDGVDMQRIQQGFPALDAATSDPLEGAPYGAPHTPQRDTCAHQAFAETSLGLRAAVWRAVRDQRVSTVVAVMMVYAVVKVSSFLQRGTCTVDRRLG